MAGSGFGSRVFAVVGGASGTPNGFYVVVDMVHFCFAGAERAGVQVEGRLHADFRCSEIVGPSESEYSGALVRGRSSLAAVASFGAMARTSSIGTPSHSANCTGLRVHSIARRSAYRLIVIFSSRVG